MNPLRYIKALCGFGDVDSFWKAREEILKKPGKHYFENFLCKIVRKHYGAGILFCQISIVSQRLMASTVFSYLRERKLEKVA